MHRAESRLRAMLHRVEFFKQVLFATPRYTTQCEIQAKHFLVNSALCYLVWSLGVIYICEFLCEFATICKDDITHKSVTEVGLSKI
jgi:hypothetical protein